MTERTPVVDARGRDLESDSAARLSALAFFGGGTGGHLFPGLAVAERARERFPGCRIVFFRTRRNIEDRILSDWGFETEAMELDVPAATPAAWLRYSLQSVRAISEIRASLGGGFDAAFGLGGYASLPGIIAARQEGIPVILLEQNHVPGKVNRLLAPFVSAVSCPDADAARLLWGRREITGNPVRRTVLTAAGQRRRWFAASAFSSRKRRVLVVGGSQGAHGINRAIVAALEELGPFRERIHWIHITGDADKTMVEEAYRRHGWEAEVMSYAKDLPFAMANSDLVIGRAGGTTLAELTVLGVPAVLVPYPHHRDQHQLRNAQALVEAGGARLVHESALGADALRLVFEDLLFLPERLFAMEDAARSLARPEAADSILDLVLELKATCP